jgi:hypothetical protein
MLLQGMGSLDKQEIIKKYERWFNSLLDLFLLVWLININNNNNNTILKREIEK